MIVVYVGTGTTHVTILSTDLPSSAMIFLTGHCGAVFLPFFSKIKTDCALFSKRRGNSFLRFFVDSKRDGLPFPSDRFVVFLSSVICHAYNVPFGVKVLLAAVRVNVNLRKIRWY